MRTELGKAMEMLSVLAEMGDIDFVRDAGKRIAQAQKKTYTPKKDKELLNWLTKEEKEEFLSLSL